jgi:hypothetical protein
MSTETAPLTPPDCDLRDFPRMMIDIPRLRASAFDATPDDAAWRAALNLWMSSWHGDPAASLENDDAALCKAASLGRDLRTWNKVKAVALRGWTLCSDGRLYHATVAEFALEAWLDKLAQRLSSGAGNAKRWGSTFDPEPIKDEIAAAAALLAALNPKANGLQKASRHISGRNPAGKEKPSQRDDETVPTGSQGKGREGIDSSEDKSSGAEAPSPDFDKEAWDGAVRLLTSRGDCSDKAARGLFGKLLSQNGLQARDLLPTITNAAVNGTQDPQAYLTKAARGVATRRGGAVAQVEWC